MIYKWMNLNGVWIFFLVWVQNLSMLSGSSILISNIGYSSQFCELQRR